MILYHASPDDGIDELIPQKISTPGIEEGTSPARIYAGNDPAYAAAHGFRWETKEGFNLGFVLDDTGKEIVKLSVPRHLMHRLDQPVSVYSLPSDDFEVLAHVNPPGRNFASSKPVKPIDKKIFPSITSAIEFYGGKVDIYDTPSFP